MTTEDKTGDKLVASIRKTKAGASGPADTDATRPPAATTRKKTVAKKAVADDAAAAEGQYQSVRRVWPD
jgi:hypothetical protein